MIFQSSRERKLSSGSDAVDERSDDGGVTIAAMTLNVKRITACRRFHGGFRIWMFLVGPLRVFRRYVSISRSQRPLTSHESIIQWPFTLPARVCPRQQGTTRRHIYRYRHCFFRLKSTPVRTSCTSRSKTNTPSHTAAVETIV